MNMRLPNLAPAGIWIGAASAKAAAHAHAGIMDTMHRCGLDVDLVFRHRADRSGDHFQVCLQQDLFESMFGNFETLPLRLGRRTNESPEPSAIMQEILLTMLAAPVPLVFDHIMQFESHLRIRQNIVCAAKKTALSFETTTAERPEAYWQATEDRGYVLREGVSLEDAIIATTQPEVTGRMYGFSCYRATEYLLLLGIAQEAKWVAPDYLAQIEQQCRQEVLRSDPFHLAYACEYGTMERPLPPFFYVPGDRVWFKNPDHRSSDVTGFEGSWVFYLGEGRFSNFWHRDQPFDLVTKCLEIYHWRHAVVTRDDGEMAIDEDLVAQWVSQTRRDPVEMSRVMDKMMAYRDPGGVYADGGCIDSTREIPRPNLF